MSRMFVFFFCIILKYCGGDGDQFRSTCDEMISDCMWNNKEIECYEAFLPLETEFGVCYTINSIHTTYVCEQIVLTSLS